MRRWHRLRTSSGFRPRRRPGGSGSPPARSTGSSTRVSCPAYRMGRVIRLQATDVDALHRRAPASSPAPSSTSTPTPPPRADRRSLSRARPPPRRRCGRRPWPAPRRRCAPSPRPGRPTAARRLTASLPSSSDQPHAGPLGGQLAEHVAEAEVGGHHPLAGRRRRRPGRCAPRRSRPARRAPPRPTPPAARRSRRRAPAPRPAADARRRSPPRCATPRSARSSSTPAKVASASAAARSQRSRARASAEPSTRASASQASSRAARLGAPPASSPSGAAMASSHGVPGRPVVHGSSVGLTYGRARPLALRRRVEHPDQDLRSQQPPDAAAPRRA